METATYPDNESMDAEMIDDHESTSLEDILSSKKTSAQRVQYLKRHFYQSEQPIQDIDFPRLWKDHPDFAQDIATAYLTHTKFTAKITVNYDGACKQFFDDGRKRNCGKLVVNAKGRKRLDEIKNPGLQFNIVQLEVGTAFRTFTHIVLRASEATGEVMAKNKPHIGDHPLLMKFLNNLCHEISRKTLPDKQSGFTVDDIEEIAGWCVRQDHKPLMEYRNSWGKQDEWSTIVSSGRGFHSNPGYLAYGSDLQKWPF